MYRYTCYRPLIKEAGFGLFLVLLAAFAVITAILSVKGPLVLGTELNANGTVEYLCLGNGCQNPMDW